MTYRIAAIQKGATAQIIDADGKVLFKRIDGNVEKQYRAVVLHELDLRFCQSCLRELKSLDYNKQSELAEAYWVSCITRFFKCFGQSKARPNLPASKIFKTDADSTSKFEYFRALRNKHIVHDENPFSDVLVTVAVNASDRGTPFVEVFGAPIHLFMVESDLVRLEDLVNKALEWVGDRRRKFEEQLTATYCRWPREKLLALRDVVIQPPSDKDVFSTRT
jgi:hypothetical protein